MPQAGEGTVAGRVTEKECQFLVAHAQYLLEKQATENALNAQTACARSGHVRFIEVLLDQFENIFVLIEQFRQPSEPLCVLVPGKEIEYTRLSTATLSHAKILLVVVFLCATQT